MLNLARFRAKKKAKEQLLRKTTENMTAHVDQLQLRLMKAEMEIKWLRSLLIEKGDKPLLQKLYRDNGIEWGETEVDG